MDRWQVFSIPGADFLLKIIIPSCWTIEKTTRSGISFGSHWQNAECEPRFFYPSVSVEIMSGVSGKFSAALKSSCSQCLPFVFSKWRLVYFIDAEWLVHQRRIYYFSLWRFCIKNGDRWFCLNKIERILFEFSLLKYHTGGTYSIGKC